MADEIRLELRSVKNTSVLLDWVPIIGKIRMNNLKTEHSMIKKLNCFGWHFDGFGSKYTGTEYRVYGNTVSSHDNYDSYLNFCRPEYYYGGKFFKVMEWLFFKTLKLYKFCRWIWLITLILGGVLLSTSPTVGALLMAVPLGIVVLSNVFCFIGKRLNKKAEELTKIVLEGNGYKPEWGVTPKEFVQIVKRMKKNKSY